MTTARTFYKENLTQPPTSTVKVTKGEYYIDTDPGFGKGTNIPFIPAPDLTNIAFTLDMSKISVGNHKLFVRFQDQYGRWSATSANDFKVESPAELMVSIGTINGPLCANGAVAIPFTVSAAFGSNNVFTAQLSDANGTFTNPIAIGTLKGTDSGSIDALIPANTPAGVNYRIRVISSSPDKISAANSTALTINRLPENFTLSGVTSSCLGAQTYTTTILSEGSLTYAWSVSGGGTLAADNNSATVTWTTPGTHTIKLTATNDCGSSVEKTLAVSVSGAAPTLTPTITTEGKWMHSSTAPAGAGVTGYQWYENGGAISGATTPSYFVNNNAASYTVRYQNACGVGPESNPVTYTDEKQNQTITFAAIPDKTYGDEPFKLEATASSGLPVSFEVEKGPATVTGNILTITRAGEVIILALQEGDSKFNPAPSERQRFEVKKSAQTISFTPISDRVFGDAPFSINADASSGLPVDLEIVSVSDNASIEDNIVTIKGVGSVTIRASQGGNSNYLPAISKDQTFCISINQLGSIAGNTDVCLGKQTYSVPQMVGATYSWKLSGGGTIITSNNTATVNWTSVGSFKIEVTASSNCGENELSTSLQVSVENSLLPSVASNLLPINGAVGLSLPLNLSWKPSDNTDFYDLYIWPDSIATRPEIPFASNLRDINYVIREGINYGIWYKWQVVSRNKCNRSESSVHKFTLRQLPDIFVYNVQTPETAIAGSSIGVRWKVSNKGAGSTLAETWTDNVYLSSDTIFDASNDILLGTTRNVSYLQPSQVYNGVANFPIPVSVFGQYYVFITSNALILEEDRTNNTARSINFIPITVVPLPDLRPVSIAMPATAFGNDSVTVTYSFKNEGNATIFNNTWTDQVFISPDSNFIASNSHLLSTVTLRAITLPKDSTYTQRHRIKIPHSKYGDYYVHVLSNASRGFEEISRDNNINSTKKTSIKLRPPADLVVTDISVPTEIFSGYPIQINWKVQNQGANGPIETAWSDKVYISKSPSFNINSATYIGKSIYTRDNDFSPDATYLQSGNFKLPDSLSGKYYVYVVADADSTVFEYTFEENNLARSKQQFTINYAYADLVGLQGQIELDSINLGEPITLSWITSNKGPNTAFAQWTDGIYLSRDRQLSSDDILLGEYLNTGDLLAGEEFTRTVKLSIRDALAGNYFVLVNLDRSNTILEYDSEGKNLNENNVLVLPKGVYVKSYGISDLAILEFSTGKQLFSGQSLALKWQVGNIGTSNLALKQDFWNDRIYLSEDSIANPDVDILLTTRFNNNKLASGESYTQNASIQLPPDKIGDYFLILRTEADSVNSNDFSNSNNTKAIAVSISLTDPSDLFIEQLSPPQQVIAGQQLYIPYTISNKGKGKTNTPTWSDQIFLSTTPTFNTGSLVLGIGTKERNGELAPNESYTDSILVNIPPSFSGFYYVIGFADANNKVYEHLAEDNNSKATLIEIVPPVPSDFIITQVGVPSIIGLGDDFQSEYIIKNAGTGRGLGILKDGLYFSSPNATIPDTDKDKLLGVQLGYVDLQPGQSITRFISTKVKDINPGEYRGITSTDLLNNILEASDENNHKAADNNTDITISELALGIEKIALLNNGDLRYYKIQVEEDLDLVLTLSSNQPEGQNKVFIAYNRVPTSSDFDFQNANIVSTNQQVLVPGTKAGTYYVLIQSDTEFAQAQQIKIFVKALPFSILSITPDKVGQGRVTCNLTGARFTLDTEIYLQNSKGEKIVQASIIEFVSSMQLKVRWQLESVPVGRYDVMAINEEVEAEMKQGLEVVPVEIFQVAVQEQIPTQIRAGTNGLFAFRMENTSNVDIPYIQFLITIPSNTPVTTYSTSKNVITKSKIDSLFEKAQVNDWEERTLKHTNNVVRDLSPGEIFTVNLQVKPTLTGTLDVNLFGLGFSNQGFKQNLDSLIEYHRKIILSTPGLFNTEFRKLASNAGAFRDSVESVLIRRGLLAPIDSPNNLHFAEKSIQADICSTCGNAHTQLEANIASTATGTANPELCRRQKCDDARINCTLPLLIELGAQGPFAARAGIKEFGEFIWDMFTGTARDVVENEITGEPNPCLEMYRCSGVPSSGRGTGIFRRRIDQIDEATSEDGTNEDPCNPPPTPPSSTKKYPVPVIRAGDPNDITGPKGYGPQRFISNQNAIPYTVRFENDPKLATTAAQLVTIVLPLDEQVNPLSLRVGSFGFSNFSFQVPDNIASYTKVLNLPDSLGYDVEVSAGVDIINKIASWTFQTIDPKTGLPPTDPLSGFLPINDSTGLGEGFVTYSVKPKANVQTGDSITAQATIVFDIEAPIATNTWFNVIDATPPKTLVQKLPEISPGNQIPIQFGGEDDDSGSGIGSYALYFNKNNGPFLNYGEFRRDSVAIFNGEPGSKYQFFSLGIDNVGNAEEMKDAPEASTTIPTGNRAPVFKLNSKPITRLSLSGCLDSPIDQCITVTDPEQDLIQFTLASTAKNLTTTLTTTGIGFCINLVPKPNFIGIDSLQISACDSTGNCSVINLIVKIDTNPVVTLSPFEDVEENTPAFVLSGGSPEGGIYNGPGVKNGIFDPAIAGLGTFKITYSFTNANGCVSTALQEIKVIKSNREQQTITFAQLTNKTYGGKPFKLFATASSDLLVKFDVVEGPAIISNDTLTITGAGIVKVRASQEGNDHYEAAEPIVRSFIVEKASQTITLSGLEPLPDDPDGNRRYRIIASSSSGLLVTFSVLSGPATISGNILTLSGSGEVRIRSSQTGNANYLPAPDLDQTLNFNKVNQTITFNKLSDKTFGDAPFNLSATASSGLPVTFEVESGPATINGTIVTITGTGVVVIKATQLGNEEYFVATPVFQSFTVKSTALCPNTGNITYERWDHVPSKLVELHHLPTNVPPTTTGILTSFVVPSNMGENYFARVRGYLCVPVSGQYRFHLAADDRAELLLSTDDNPGNKVRIAYLRKASKPSRYNEFATQESGMINLEAGKRYYIESVMREFRFKDHLSVAWTKPDGTMEVIPSSNLTPYTTSEVLLTTVISPEIEQTPQIQTLDSFTAHPNPFSDKVAVGFTLAAEEEVILEVYNLQGQLVQTLFAGKAMAGKAYQYEFDGSKLANGVYICRIMVAGKTTVKRLLLDR
ncbi:PKD domain-containing protein [Rufibacter sp. H-1]|uniref:PKD domain-containing protein n=4 Tax=Rufibacter sediminis TaxID=2762756 RepID=A0ABR6VYF0_9BACT|nr:CARDB domain-containing protein [Rufibacter sediminis]MBC3542128.1 PKD domain-containing protein [Rufibacter sediminis]